MADEILRFPHTRTIDADGHLLEPASLWEEYLEERHRSAIACHSTLVRTRRLASARRPTMPLAMRSFDELESLWRASPPAPRGDGTVRLIVLRKGGGVHETPARVEISPESGLCGDRWELASDPDRDGQVTLMNARAAELIADGGPLDLPGDNLVVDLDLGAGALQIGARIRVGSALLEVSPMPHTGCRKFAARFGQDALRWVNWKEHRDRRLRGINCRVIEAGSVAIGEPCRVE